MARLCGHQGSGEGKSRDQGGDNGAWFHGLDRVERPSLVLLEMKPNECEAMISKMRRIVKCR
jgi:hypothetical protein